MAKLKTCGHCKKELSFKNFNKCKDGRFGLHNHCRACQKIVRHEWYLKNKDHERIKAKEYSKTDKCLELRKLKWAENKHILGPKSNARRRTEAAKIKARAQRSRWYAIPHNRIAQTLRGRVRKALKNGIKIAHTETLVGCSFNELKCYLESKFKLGMTWENYGSWHIDHILPCSSFDLTIPEEQVKCFHYSNLQPLWAYENRSKGNKLI